MTWYTLYRGLGWPQSRCGRMRKIFPPSGIRSTDRSARSESLYWLSYPGPHAPFDPEHFMMICPSHLLFCRVSWCHTHQKQRTLHSANGVGVGVHLMTRCHVQCIDRFNTWENITNLVFGAAWPGKYVPSFRINLMPPYSDPEDCTSSLPATQQIFTVTIMRNVIYTSISSWSRKVSIPT